MLVRNIQKSIYTAASVPQPSSTPSGSASPDTTTHHDCVDLAAPQNINFPQIILPRPEFLLNPWASTQLVQHLSSIGLFGANHGNSLHWFLYIDCPLKDAIFFKCQ